ncbi:MAG TPA: GYD domain-containing protein [Candidatus Binataceae bacterium]|nr:GYD domain-containing protein [Candidatus Binataceae bacterium]
MANYVIFFHITHQGLDHLKGGPERIEAIRQDFDKHGAKVKDFYAFMGHPTYDTMFLVEAPSDEAISQLVLKIEAAGNVRSETHRAFNFDEWKKLVAGVGK